MKELIAKSLMFCSLAVFLLIGGLPAHSGIPWLVEFEYIECVPDNNESSVTATLVNRDSIIHDAVCPADQFDWFYLPLNGDITWGGSIMCIADGPGLAVKLYHNDGSGLQMIAEGSPVETGVNGYSIYMLDWDLLDIVAGMGHAAAPSGNYYIRVTYFSAYPGEHPYKLSFWLEPEGFLASPYNSSSTARPLPPGILRYGYLDATDNSDWYTFDIEPSQTGTGIIFGENVRKYPMSTFEGNGGFPGDIEPCTLTKKFDIKLRNSDLSIVDTTTVPKNKHSYIELGDMYTLTPGTYYLEVIYSPVVMHPGYEAYYMIFNHARAPNTGTWWTDTNIDDTSATPLAKGVPAPGSVYYPRDGSDFFSFTSPGNFLGDILIEPASDYTHLHATLVNDEGYYVGGHWMPGFGLTCRNMPQVAGDYCLQITDMQRMFHPTDYMLTFYQHGVPMTGPTGHNTWETALELPPGMKGGTGSTVIDFQPGVQDVFFLTLTVPADNLLVGYYDMKGSRPDYRVRLGKLGPGGTPVWSPALTPNSHGNLYIDMDYEFLSDQGTYFLKVDMLPSSPGRMRIYVGNQSRIAQCEPDNNFFFADAWDLKSFRFGYKYVREGTLCPGQDDADWYYFDSGLFDEVYGPRQNLSLRGAAAGMRVELYDGQLSFLAYAEVTEMGGYANIDLDGAIVSVRKYYIRVMASPTENRVQVYDLELCNDFQLMLLFAPIERWRSP